MDTAEVNESVDAAISSERAQIIGLVGDWGVGKTHLWKDYVFANREGLSKRYAMYAYFSLFGVSSTRDIKAGILDKLIPTQLVSKDPAKTIEEAAKEQTKRVVAITKGLLAKARELTKKSDSGWASIGAEAINMAVIALEYKAAQKALICFDDLERMSPSLSPPDVMGVVDDLARERGCKVVVIYSPENMGRHADDLKRYREKLFDRELRLDPPIAYSLGIGCEKLDKLAADAISDCAKRLGLKNIRIIRRIADGLLDIRAHVPRMQDAVEQNIVSSLVLLTYCHLVSKAGMPTLDEVAAIPYVGSDRDEKPKAHIDFLKEYGWMGFQEPDPLVCEYVRNGTCDWKAFSTWVDSTNAEQSKFVRVERVREIWREYRNRFMNVLEFSEFCGRLAARYTEEAGVVDTRSLDDAMDLLRGANEPKLANNIFSAWKTAHSEDRALLNLDEIERYEGVLLNRDLTDYCRQQFEQMADGAPRNVREILIRMSNDRSWGGDDTVFLATASVGDYVAALRQGMQDIIHAVKHLLKAHPDEEHYPTIAKSLNAALKLLAAESPVNQWKVKALGVDLSGPA